jgi:NAD(P)-dependent dehydrogenase (short-subunit alcohol dehydrogenase family)
VEVTDTTEPRYRGSVLYDLAKASMIRLAFAQAAELKPRRITAVALIPGFLRSEAMLDGFGVTVDTWRDVIAKDPHFAASGTPRYFGRAVACLAADPGKMADTGSSYKINMSRGVGLYIVGGSAAGPCSPGLGR